MFRGVQGNSRGYFVYYPFSYIVLNFCLISNIPSLYVSKDWFRNTDPVNDFRCFLWIPGHDSFLPVILGQAKCDSGIHWFSCCSVSMPHRVRHDSILPVILGQARSATRGSIGFPVAQYRCRIECGMTPFSKSSSGKRSATRGSIFCREYLWMHIGCGMILWGGEVV